MAKRIKTKILEKKNIKHYCLRKVKADIIIGAKINKNKIKFNKFLSNKFKISKGKLNLI
jgi:hypothetical protein